MCCVFAGRRKREIRQPAHFFSGIGDPAELLFIKNVYVLNREWLKNSQYQKQSFPNIAVTIVKQIAAILLLSLFLFNLVGYRLLFQYAQQQADVQLTASLDNHQYNDEDLISITVPLSMPYQTIQSDFERVDGEIKVNGNIYKYVKRRIVNGELVLLCLPDHNKMRIESAKDDFFKTTTDIAQDHASKKADPFKSGAGKNLQSDYDRYADVDSISFRFTSSPQYPLFQKNKLLTRPQTPPVQPPDVI